MNKQEILAVAKAINADLVGGALGEMEGCAAYVEEVKMSDQGYLTKYFGISYYFHGKTDNDVIDRVTITKRAFKEILKLSWFRPQKILDSFYQIYACEGGLKSKCLKLKEFCPACQELIRIGLKLAGGNEKFVGLVYCLAMFLQFSPTYRLWLQDIAEEIDKDNFEKRPLTEFRRLKRIFMERLNVEHKKAEFIWRLVFFGVLLNRKSARKLVRELDIEKVKLDDIDFYFCCRRPSYNFRGLPIKQRLEEAEKTDLKEGNIILEV